MDALYSVLFYNILLLIVFVWYWIKMQAKYNATTYICFFLFIVSVISAFYFISVNGIIRNYENITVIPFIYLVLCYLISLRPIVRYDNTKELKLFVGIEQERFIKIFIGVMFLITLEPFVENIIYLPNALKDESFASRMYDNRVEYLSYWGRKLNAISSWFEMCYPIFIFYFLSKKYVNKQMLICLFVIILNFWMHELGLGGRSKLVQNILYILVIYFIMRRFIDREVDKKLILYGTIIISLGILFIMIISISRFSAMETTTNMTSIWMWLGLYAGEGPLNFNSMAWHITDSTHGDNTFILLKYLLGLTDAVSIQDVYNSTARLGIIENVFYTYVGSFFMDFNVIGTLVLLSILSILISVFTAVKKYITIQQIVVLAIGARILIVPTFYTYSSFNSQVKLFITILFCLILIINQKYFRSSNF